jgi:hypothetical protein
MTLSVFAGATPPTHVVPDVHVPPVAVLVMTAALAPCAPPKTRTRANKIATEYFVVLMKSYK